MSYTIEQNVEEHNTISFHFENENVGKLYVDECGRMKFEGKLHESAKIFLETVCAYWNMNIYIPEKNNKEK